MLKSIAMNSNLQTTYEQAHDWILMTHQRLIDVGCVQTLDTGQYAGMSGTGALSAATTLGYRIYELNDAYSSQQPVYFKITFKIVPAGSSFINPFGVYELTVGFATNGAGNITGYTAPTAQQLYIPAGNSSASAVLGQARTLAAKGDDFLYMGGQLGLGYQTTSNLLNSGFFGILRNKSAAGAVNPNILTVIYPNTTTGYNVSLPLRYQKLSKTAGPSPINTHMHAMPRINNVQGVLVATEADITELGVLETTDTLLAIRSAAADTPWATYTLSMDGITAHKYLHIPTAFTSIPPTSANIPINAYVDSRDNNLGCLGLIWDD